MTRCKTPRRLLVACLALLAIAPFASTAVSQEYEVHVETDVMVPTSDGTKLATDIYRPAKDGQPVDEAFPTILVRTPYNKAGNRTPGNYFAARGYTFVSQDTRGRYGSEGVWHMLTDDGPDGADCCEWIANQSWSNGKIGMLGTSYVGGTQHALAMHGSPHLKTIIPVDAMSNLGYASMRNGGAFELRFWNWIMLNSWRGSRASKDPGTTEILKEMSDNRHAYLTLFPLRKGMTPLRLSPEYEDWLVEAMKRGANDEYWEQNNIIDYPQRYQNIPVYLVGGWYDSWGSNTTANYRVLTETKQAPTYLIMGPWIHGAQSSYQHGQVSFGPDAAIKDQWEWRKHWFDRWLKDDDSVVGKDDPFQTPVRIFVMGTGDGRKLENGRLNHGGFWRNENEWPLARTKYVSWHLHPEGRLAPESPSAVDARTQFAFDPTDPVPTIGGNISSGNDILLQGAWNQKGGEHVWNWQKPIPLSARNDVVVYQSEPLEKDLEVTGELEVELYASSSAPDTDFTAKLIDVYPPSEDYPGGFDLILGDGIIRTRFRDSIEEEKLMTPGEVYKMTIRLYPTSNVFKKGHRIRVDVSSSNFPRFDVNPNTGEPLNDHRNVQSAINVIHHSQQHPSRIILPVIED